MKQQKREWTTMNHNNYPPQSQVHSTIAVTVNEFVQEMREGEEEEEDREDNEGRKAASELTTKFFIDAVFETGDEYIGNDNDDEEEETSNSQQQKKKKDNEKSDKNKENKKSTNKETENANLPMDDDEPLKNKKKHNRNIMDDESDIETPNVRTSTFTCCIAIEASLR